MRIEKEAGMVVVLDADELNAQVLALRKADPKADVVGIAKALGCKVGEGFKAPKELVKAYDLASVELKHNGE